jgi:hypothetical protein
MLNSSQLHQYYSDLAALTHLAPMLSEATASMFPGGSRYSPSLWTSFFARNYDNLSVVAPGLLEAAHQLAADNSSQVLRLMQSCIQYVALQRSLEPLQSNWAAKVSAMLNIIMVCTAHYG